MKLIPKVFTRLVLLALISVPAIANAAVHQATVSPSGRYKLASESVRQETPKTTKLLLGREIGAKISLIGRDGAVISKCFLPGEGAYPDVPKMIGREDWETKAYWNDDETRVAVYSGGRIWSRIDFYSIVGGRIAILPHPDWDDLLFDLPGYEGETTRRYEGFLKWTKNDTCRMEFSGTAHVEGDQEDDYPLFSYTVTMRITLERVQFLEVKNR